MIEINELDILLNTLETSSIEPHEEYKMEFSNREQKLIYDYIKDLQRENQQLKSQLKQRDEVIKEAIKRTNKIKNLGFDTIAKREILDILKKYKGDSNE